MSHPGRKRATIKAASSVVRFRVSPALRARLDRLKAERDVNLSAWLRTVVSQALDDQLGPAAIELATADPAASKAPAPIPGWRPAQLPRVAGGGWGAAFEGSGDDLPDDLAGAEILVSARSGDSWIATVEAVVERSAQRVIVRAPRPRKRS